MKVKAKELLYYNNKRYRAGQVFSLNKTKDFSERSMINLAAPKAAPKVMKSVSKAAQLEEEVELEVEIDENEEQSGSAEEVI